MAGVVSFILTGKPLPEANSNWENAAQIAYNEVEDLMVNIPKNKIEISFDLGPKVSPRDLESIDILTVLPSKLKL